MEKSIEMALSLAVDSMKAKTKLEERNFELEKLITEKQAMIDTDKEMISKLQKELKDREEEVQDIISKLENEKEEADALRDLNQVLITKERSANVELENARKELIDSFKEVECPGFIGLKRMGDVDIGPFREVARKRKEECAEIYCSIWQNRVSELHSWNPFKIITRSNGDLEEVIDEENEELKEMKSEYGEEVYKAVTTALMEIKEYNPSGMYPVQVLWNFLENRKATVQEGIACLVKKNQLAKGPKRKRT